MLSVSLAKFAAVWTVSESIGAAIAQQLRGRPGHFTDRPAKSYLGKNPGKTANLGGMWFGGALKSAARYKGAKDGTPLSPGEERPYWRENCQVVNVATSLRIRRKNSK
jgi:hypothetical protein